MANLFLLNSSVKNIVFNEFQEGIDDLISIKDEKQENDNFYKNDNIYYIKNFVDLCQNFSFENQNRIKFLEQLTSLTNNPKTLDELNEVFPQELNAFLGIDFSQSSINNNFCVYNTETFSRFKEYCFCLVNHTNFSELKEEVFPHLIFCDNSETQLLGFGNSKEFSQCLQQFIELEKYLKDWMEGNFNYRDLKENTSINISPESETTRNQHSNERLFDTINGKKVYDLHIKLGDGKRIYIMPENSLKKIMIGYVGKHLTI